MKTNKMLEAAQALEDAAKGHRMHRRLGDSHPIDNARLDAALDLCKEAIQTNAEVLEGLRMEGF